MRGCQADDLVEGLLKLDAHFAVDSPGIAIVCELQQLDVGLVECRLKLASRFERQILDLFAGYFTAAKSTHKGADHFLDVPLHDNLLDCSYRRNFTTTPHERSTR